MAIFYGPPHTAEAKGVMPPGGSFWCYGRVLWRSCAPITSLSLVTETTQRVTQPAELLTWTSHLRLAFDRFGAIGDRPDDPPAERTKHRLLVFMALLLAFTALVWFVLALAIGLGTPIGFPLAYMVLTGVNLIVFARSKRFETARTVQTLVTLALPFGLQWSLGGFSASGAAMLWGLVALAGALTFSTPRAMRSWLLVYGVLIAISAAVDRGDTRQVTMFVTNVVLLSAAMLALITNSIRQLSEAKAAITNLREEVQHAQRLGQYILLEKIGQGGMGEVYRAQHAMLRRPTALKLVRADRTDEETLARFEREVQHTAELTHPNTITIYDYGRTNDGTFYYAMEYLDGADLGAIVELTGAMGPARAIHVLVQIAEALTEAHGRGLVHRDIKPANVLLTSTHAADVVKVVDFGLVKHVGTGADALVTQAGAISGTPMYMSPEALTAPETLGPSADVYAVGCIAHFLITGSPVFAGRTLYEIIGHHLYTPPDRARGPKGEELPPPLADMVLACLAKQPDARPTMADVASTLRRLMAIPELAWGVEEGARWWNQHGELLRAHRASHATSVDRSVVARAPLSVTA